MPSRRTGLIFPGAPSVPEMVELARRAEAQGFDSVWMAETRLTRDAVTPVAAMALATERIRVGTGIMNVFTRNPVVIAISFVSLEELAPGRILMGLGTGSPLVLAPQGVPFEKPLTRLREYCEVVPRLIHGDEVSFEGETIRLEGAQIEDLLSARGGLAGARARIPLWLGVTGPRALEYAGEVADGVLLNICLPTEYVTRARERIATGARRAGRDAGEIELAMGVVVSPDADSALAKRRAALFVALYLSLFPNIARETGVDEALVERVRATFHERGLEPAGDLVPDAVVDRLTAAGTPEECRARLEAYHAAGVELTVLAPVEGSMDLTIAALG